MYHIVIILGLPGLVQTPIVHIYTGMVSLIRVSALADLFQQAVIIEKLGIWGPGNEAIAMV